MKSFTVSKNDNLKDFTDCTYPQGSFVFRALLKNGDIRVNGKKVRENVRVFAGDEVSYYTTYAQESAKTHETVYEDDQIYIADKYDGVTCEGLFCSLAPYRPVHRLDRNTKGLIVLAKTEEAERELSEAFKERRVEKVYRCLAKNAFKRRKGTLTAYLKKDEKNALVRIYAANNAGCVKIVTGYEVVKGLGDVAEVQVYLHTGKTHQIRAHLAFIGCPVLGDTKYGDRELNEKYNFKRQVLISKRLTFHTQGCLAYLDGKTFESRFSPEIEQ